MKFIFSYVLYFFFLLFNTGKLAAQDRENRYVHSTINLPTSQSLITSLFVNEINQVFLPLNGGIYLPKDSLWFIPPSKGYYFTSFAPNVKDTGFFVVANTSDSSELFYLKSSRDASIKRYPVLKLNKGLYNVIFRNNTCYIWGHDTKGSRIGILVNNEIKWLLNLSGVIQQVQVNDSSEIFFALNKAIYKLNNQQIVLSLNKEIHGFCFDKSGNIILSTADWVGVQNEDKIDIIATGMSGLSAYENDSIFIVSNKAQQINIISKL